MCMMTGYKSDFKKTLEQIIQEQQGEIDCYV